MLLQPLEIYAVWLGPKGDAVDVYPFQDSAIRHLMTLATWQGLRKELTLWMPPVSDRIRCVELHAPQKIQPKADLADPTCPEVVCLEVLRARGWNPMARRAPHRAVGDELGKYFLYVRGQSSKRYLQCLLKLEELGGRGLAELHLRQTVSYYDAILHAPDPSEVHLDQPSKHYQALVKSIQDGQAGQDPGPMCAAENDISDQHDNSGGDDSIVGANAPATVNVEVAGAMARAAPRAAAAAQAASPATSPSQASSASSGSGSTSGSNSSDDRSDDDSASSIIADEPTFPDTLEGCPLRLDSHQPAHGSVYCRLMLVCDKHPNCKKYCGLGQRQ